MSYTHLSPEERYYIEISLKNEIGLAEIAASLTLTKYDKQGD